MMIRPSGKSLRVNDFSSVLVVNQLYDWSVVKWRGMRGWGVGGKISKLKESSAKKI